MRARATLEGDLGGQLEGRFGIHADGAIEAEDALPDDATDRATRRELVEIIDHLCSLGETESNAVTRLLREVAFTHLNRLLAIRIAEAIGLLPESLANGRQSRGFRDLGEIMPILSDDYWGYLQLCGDELAADAPTLFDPRNPLLALAPSTAASDEVVALLADASLEPVWPTADTLGWAYQFFNTGDERRAMREAAAAPRTSRELAVRNQFFTPRDVVDFLVQNTLGRRLIENDPTSPLRDELPLLVDPPTERGLPVDLRDVAVLDPACGSGHFLLGCYDLLERAWELQGIPPSESAPEVVASLWGVDIDARCSQVASSAIVLRARRHCREHPVPQPHIVTARRLPGASDAFALDLRLDSAQRDLLNQIAEALGDAPLLGTLLKAEEVFEQEIRYATFGGAVGTLPLNEDAFAQAEAHLIADLEAIADQTSSSVGERLLVAEAEDALRLVEVVRKRYDAVLMNPPFGEPVPETKAYLRTTYPWLPTKDNNLLAAFVGRGLELCKPGGYMGAITSRVGMFLKTFEAWRREVLLANRVVTLADFGNRVMEQAMVEAAAYVVAREPARPDDRGTFIRLLRSSDRAAALTEAVTHSRASIADPRVFSVRLDELDAIPGAPIAYWLGPGLRRLFETHPVLESNAADVRVGLQTGDDPRFIRTAWEVSPRSIARSRADTRNGKRWVPYAKGGEYSPYWSDLHLVVDWESEGTAIRNHGGSAPSAIDFYFRPGLTWPRRTASGFGPRVLPAGAIFGNKGPAAFAKNDRHLTLLAWLASRVSSALIGTMLAAGDEVTSGGAAKSYEVGLVQKLPWLPEIETLDGLADLTLEMATLVAEGDECVETARRFVVPAVLSAADGLSSGLLPSVHLQVRRDIERRVTCIEASARAEAALIGVTELDQAATQYLDEEVGPHPAHYERGAVDEAEFNRLFTMPIDQVINQVVAERGGSRWIVKHTFVVDRRLEVLAHTFGRPPRQLAEIQSRLGLLPPEEPVASARDLLSYVVGCAFGRWDVRIGREPSLAPPLPALFEPVPLCPPGLLVGTDGFPCVDAPTGYPFQFAPGRLMVDESGHPWDIEKCILRAARLLFEDPDAIMDEILDILGAKTVREVVRKRFFKDHLSRYSQSRRKAPIYWPLTVPARNWGVWIYAPMLSRETLYAVASEAGRRERLASEAIGRLQREQQGGGRVRPEGRRGTGFRGEDWPRSFAGFGRSRTHCGTRMGPESR